MGTFGCRAWAKNLNARCEKENEKNGYPSHHSVARVSVYPRKFPNPPMLRKSHSGVSASQLSCYSRYPGICKDDNASQILRGDDLIMYIPVRSPFFCFLYKDKSKENLV